MGSPVSGDRRWCELAAGILLAGLAGCAAPGADGPGRSPEDPADESQRQLEIARALEDQRRLTAVAYPLLRAATPLCVEDLGRGVGLHLANVYAYAPEDRAAAAAALGLDERVRILQVSPGSASAAAGLTPGDVVVGINGIEIAPGRGALDKARDALDAAARAGGAIELVVHDSAGPRRVEIEPEPICYVRVVLVDDAAVDAGADGEHIYVSRGMLRFAAGQDELALVVAHELAHTVLAHDEARRTGRMVGQLLDLAAKAYGLQTRGAFTTLAMRGRSAGLEVEADYVTLYVLALAGLPIDRASEFWHRLETEAPAGVDDGYLEAHPPSAERHEALAPGIAEVRSRQAAGARLMPEHRRFVSRFETPPLAFRTERGMALDTRSGRPIQLPGGCWRRVGKTRYGTVYVPVGGTLSVHGERAALVLADAAARGLWKIDRARFLAFDDPLPMDAVAEPLFACDGDGNADAIRRPPSSTLRRPLIP